MSSAGIDRRVRKGTLHPHFRGVYRVGHQAPNAQARYMGAVLACGDGAALSGLAAAFVLGLIRRGPPPPEVTTSLSRRVAGVRVHRVRGLDRRDVSVVDDIPITTVPRTIVDLAGRLERDSLGALFHEAAVRYRVTPAAVEASLGRRGRVAGSKQLRAVIHGDDQIVLSKLERAFLNLLHVADLPLPQTNRPAGAHYVDCRWPGQRLTVELDGYHYHHTRHAWERDRRRARAARARGDEFRSYTYGDVTEDAASVIDDLRERLEAETATPAPPPRTP